MKKLLPPIVIVLLALYYFSRSEPPTPSPAPRPQPRPTGQLAPTPAPEPAESEKPAPRANPQPLSLPQTHPVKIVDEKSKSKQFALPYKIQNGLFIVHGDIVAGVVPKGETIDPEGLVAMEPLKLWPSRIIPYHIQPDVPNPERILQALRLFEGTVIQFVKYSDGPEALVFENGESNCQSYIGKVTPKQPVFLAPDCSPDNIAHEILHALGFIHEQSRSDRDTFVDVQLNNIDEQFKDNFEKLPPDYMKVSGLGEFDYQSLMMYPPWMFAKPGQVTMEPRQRDRLLGPKAALSPLDIERLNRAYANR